MRPKPNDPCDRCGDAYEDHPFMDNRRRCMDGRSFKPLNPFNYPAQKEARDAEST